MNDRVQKLITLILILMDRELKSHKRIRMVIQRGVVGFSASDEDGSPYDMQSRQAPMQTQASGYSVVAQNPQQLVPKLNETVP